MKISQTMTNVLLTVGAVVGLALGTQLNAQQVSAASGVATVYYVKGYGIALWNSSDANKKPIAGRKLMDGTSWKYSQTKVVNGVTWYKLGTNQWAEGTYFKTAAPMKTIHGMLTIKYVPGYSVLLRQSPNGKATSPAKYLKNGTDWKYDATSVVNGKTWYRVGTNQWLDGKYASKNRFSDLTPNDMRSYIADNFGVPSDILSQIADSDLDNIDYKMSTGTRVGIGAVVISLAKKYPQLNPYNPLYWS
ncbi:SLAP domain-containing protein [Lacticaseibacillus saniviri]